MFPEQSAGTCAVIARPVYRASLLLSMIKIELYQVSLSLGRGRSGYEISICYPKGAHYPSNNALESDRQRFTSESKHLSTRNGILVGKLIPSFLPGTSQMNSICEHIRAIQGTYHGSISEVAEEWRSIFFTYPAQSGGILFRLGEHIVYSLLPGGEEKILTLTKLLVRGSEVTLPSSCIQRKVMLYPEPDNLTDPSFYVCIDYQRPHFPVSSVIVPVYPEVGDMILVKGDDPEPWRALVLSVQQRNNALQVHFYVPHPR